MKTICSILVLLASSGLLYSQELSRSPATYEESVNAIRMLMYTPHRVKTTIETRGTPEQSWEVRSVQTGEVVGNRARTIGHIGMRYERIMIGDRSYQRLQDGGWLKRTSDGIITIISPAKPEQKVKPGDDGKATVVETTSNVEVIAQPPDTLLNQKDWRDLDRKNWLDDSGRLIRTESQHFNLQRKKFLRITAVYEYPLSIQIEEPVGDGGDK